MKDLLSKLLRWYPTRDTVIAFISGFAVIGLSILMIPTKSFVWLQITIRDIFMIFLMGIAYPLRFMLKSGIPYREYGLSMKRWHIFLPINFILAILLLFMFFSESPPPSGLVFGTSEAAKIFYIMLAGVFEVLFFYSFLRPLFERAFGIFPAILLSALFYSFHHVGFQPEYGKLIIVGILFATISRLGNSALLIYPFFWGVGACYDVLIQSQAVSPIQHAGVRSLYLAALMVVVFAWISRKVYKGRNNKGMKKTQA